MPFFIARIAAVYKMLVTTVAAVKATGIYEQSISLEKKIEECIDVRIN